MTTPRPTTKKIASGQAASSGTEDDGKKSIDADDKVFIQKMVADSHQDIYFQGWVDLYYQDKEPKKRILVVTNFRMYTIKVNVLGRSVRQQFPILDLTRLHVSKDNDKRMTLEFGGSLPSATINYEKSVIGIAQAVYFSYQAITYGRPPELLPKIELPPEFTTTYMPPEPDAQDGLLATYLAECDYNKLEQRIPVLDYLMTCFQLDDRVLDLGECLAFTDKENPKTDVHALASALRYSKWFTEITTVGFPLKNEGLASMSTLLTVPSAITKLVLVNIKAGRTGFASLSKAFGAGVHSLNFLNLSKNAIGDPGLKLLTDGLQESKKVLRTLCLRGCGFSGKGFKTLFTLLSQPAWLNGLKILDVSDNPMSKAGTQSLCEWLQLSTNTVEQLYIVACEIVPEKLFETLEANKELCKKHLNTINISGNKLTKKSIPILCRVLETTSSLSQIYLSSANVTRTFFVQIIDNVLKNSCHGLGFSLDFSNNHLGPKGVKDLETLYLEWAKKDSKKLTDSGKVHTLVLSDNELGTEGIVTACKALKGTALHALSLDRNVKVGMFASGKEAGEALAQLINETPHLKELTVAGSDAYYMKGALLPLLQALSTNNTLRHLDVSKNKLGDQGIMKLAEALAINTSLTTFNAETNKMTVKGLQALHEATTKNKTLIDWVIPMDDVTKLFKASNDKKSKELVLKLVHDLEINMERNQKLLRSSDVKVSGMTAQELETLLNTRGGVSTIRMSMAVNDESYIGDQVTSRHRKTASRLLDMMSQSDGEDLRSPDPRLQRASPSSPIPSSSPSSSPPSSSPSSPAKPNPPPGPGRSKSPAPAPPSGPVPPPGPTPPSTSLKTIKPTSVGPIASPVSKTTTHKPGTPTSAPQPPSSLAPTPPSSPPPSSPPTPPATPPGARSGGLEDWKVKTYPFEKLESNVTADHLPSGVNPAIRELYLENDKFVELFEMSKEDFQKLAKWKRDVAKKKNGLF